MDNYAEKLNVKSVPHNLEQDLKLNLMGMEWD